jgi:hypothetical protein
LGVKRFSAAFLGLAVAGAWLFIVPSAQADTRHFWRVASPDHGQTFAYGTETNRVWAERGRDQRLAVLLNFTNDPYVDDDNPRRYDHFTFSFPGVTLGKDGRTFYYRTSNGRSISVASKRPDFLGVAEIHLLPNASLIVDQPHGYLSLSLVIQDHATSAESN